MPLCNGRDNIKDEKKESIDIFSSKYINKKNMHDSLNFNINKTLIIIKVKDILYFEKDNKFIKIVLRTNKNIHIKMSLKKLVSILEEKKFFEIFFFRPHCSFVVNIDYIRLLNAKQILMINKDKIPISNAYKKDFIEKVTRNL